MSYKTAMVGETILTATTCWCGIWFAAPEDLVRMFDENGQTLHCPLGHSVVRKKTQAEIERERRITAEANLAQEQDHLDAERRSHAATRGHLTRIRNRIAKGVCPWCGRSFQNVRRHVESKHPDHLHEVES